MAGYEVTRWLELNGGEVLDPAAEHTSDERGLCLDTDPLDTSARDS